MSRLLSDSTTLRVGGPADAWVEATTEQELLDAVRAADAAGTPLLVLGGGSNLLVSDHGFPGIVVRDTRTTVDVVDDSSCGGVSVTVAAGTPWDSVVERAVDEGWVGIEALSGIPGSTGATPVQNVGAYGAEVADVIATVRTWDRHEQRVRTFMSIECGFGYRDSLFKGSMRGLADDAVMWHPSPRWVVIDVTFQLPHGTLSAPVRYDQLARLLDVEIGSRVALADVRRAVLDLRGSKGMVLDRIDHDTWSAGSFFVNPVLDTATAADLPDDAPRYPAAEGIKTSAAWLIEQAGCSKGFGVSSQASLSTKHTLALTNRGSATAQDLVDLAREVRSRVQQVFGITLEPEPVLVGVEL